MLRICVLLLVATASAFISAFPADFSTIGFDEHVKQAIVDFIQNRIDRELQILGDRLLPEIGCINFKYHSSDNPYTIRGALKATPENRNATLTCLNEWHVHVEQVYDGLRIHVKRPECIVFGNYQLEGEDDEHLYDFKMHFYRTFPAIQITVQCKLQKTWLHGLKITFPRLVEESDKASENQGLFDKIDRVQDKYNPLRIYNYTGLSRSNSDVLATDLSNKFHRKVDKQISRLKFLSFFFLGDLSDIIGRTVVLDKDKLDHINDWVAEYDDENDIGEDEDEDVECYRHEENTNDHINDWVAEYDDENDIGEDEDEDVECYRHEENTNDPDTTTDVWDQTNTY